MSDPTSEIISQPQRLAILQHGGFSTRHGKTGLSLLRYRGAEVVAVIDRETAGRSLREVSKLPDVPDIKIVASAEEALASKPTALAIGIVGKRGDAATGGHAGAGHATGDCCDAREKPCSHDTPRIASAKLHGADGGRSFHWSAPTAAETSG